MSGLYADPVVYDILYTPGTAAEVDALERVEKRFARRPLRRDRTWFEPACGSGRYLRVAAGRGRRVAGFDRDDAMLAYARGRLPGRPRLFNADMADFAAAGRRSGLPSGRIGFAFNPVNTLRHLGSDADVVAHLAQVREVLAPDGLYVVGLSLVDYDFLFAEEDVWRAARGPCRVTQVVNYIPPEPGTARARRETVISHLAVRRPRGEDHFDTSYDLHCFDRAQWRRVVRRSGLVHLTSCDGRGHDLDGRILPYQLEILGAPGRRE